jgi:hypothetical protein
LQNEQYFSMICRFLHPVAAIQMSSAVVPLKAIFGLLVHTPQAPYKEQQAYHRWPVPVEDPAIGQDDDPT